MLTQWIVKCCFITFGSLSKGMKGRKDSMLGVSYLYEQLFHIHSYDINNHQLMGSTLEELPVRYQ